MADDAPREADPAQPPIRPLGAPTDPLRPTGRVGAEEGARRPPPRGAPAKVLVALAVGLVVVPILLWVVVLLIVSLLG